MNSLLVTLSLIGSTNNLILIGERHDDAVAKAQYQNYINDLDQKNENWNCLFLELPRDMEPEIVPHLNQDLDIVLNLVADWYEGTFERLYQRMNSGFREIVFSVQFAPQLDLARTAVALGWSVHFIDLDYPTAHPTEQNEYSVSDKGVRDRNKAMAKKMKKLFEEKTCTKGVGIFGLGHIVGLKKLLR